MRNPGKYKYNNNQESGVRIILLISLFMLASCAQVNEETPRKLKGNFFDLKAEGIRHFVDGQYEKSIPYLYTASLHRPDDSETLGALGDAMLRTGRNKEGIKFLQQAIKASPYDTRPRFALGNAYKILGKYDQAAKEFLSILDTKPNNLVAIGSLGDTYYKSGNYEGCVKQFKRFIKLVEAKDPARLSESDKRFYELAKDQKTSCQKHL